MPQNVDVIEIYYLLQPSFMWYTLINLRTKTSVPFILFVLLSGFSERDFAFSNGCVEVYPWKETCRCKEEDNIKMIIAI
jgi:hypothetical protein